MADAVVVGAALAGRLAFALSSLVCLLPFFLSRAHTCRVFLSPLLSSFYLPRSFVRSSMLG